QGTVSPPHIEIGNYPLLNSPTCGLRKVNGETQSRIVAGDMASVGEFPWMASIQYVGNNGSQPQAFVCGGGLIADQWVITAKHCFLEYRPPITHVNQIIVYLGAFHKNGSTQEMKETATDFYLYPDYDLALIRLSRHVVPIVRSGNYLVNSVCVPKEKQLNSAPEFVWISGFGVIDTEAQFPTLTLRKANLAIDSYTDCLSRNFDMHFICGTETAQYPCYGDSGSPVVQFVSGRAVLVGVNIGGKADAHDHKCGGGTFVGHRISFFIDWLKHFIEPQIIPSTDSANQPKKNIVTIECIENDINCGLSRLEGQKFIVGGSDVSAGRFPFMASIQKPSNPMDDPIDWKWTHSCGATVIDKRWLLTAAHCLEERHVPPVPIQPASNELRLVLGTIDLSKTGLTYSVDRFVIHGCYDSDIIMNDIALIRTSQDIIPVLNRMSVVGTVCLPESDAEPTVPELYELGWGLNETYGTRTAQVLQKAKTYLFSEQYCLYAEYYSNIGLTGFWAPLGYKICVRNSDTSACNGDSGGPLFQIVEGRAVQLGITSHGTGNIVSDTLGFRCFRNEPVVYTRVSKYIDWIQSVVNEYQNLTQIPAKCL
ncbi:unnamed protein product, partial [Medioppia subpectinata]